MAVLFRRPFGLAESWPDPAGLAETWPDPAGRVGQAALSLTRRSA